MKNDQTRYLPREGVALRARIRTLLAALRDVKEHAERVNQEPAFSDLDNAEQDLRSALARVLPS